MEYFFENESMIKGGSASTLASVEIMVLFPNAISHKELFGCLCEKRGRRDGAVAKMLRDLERPEPTGLTMSDVRNNQAPIMKWLVMDRNPVGQPCWLDYLTTHFSPEDPFLCVPSCETLPFQSHLKLLMEMTDLRDASLSTVMCCSLVYSMGTDLWKAVWKSEMNALSFENKLDQGTLKMWN